MRCCSGATQPYETQLPSDQVLSPWLPWVRGQTPGSCFKHSQLLTAAMRQLLEGCFSQEVGRGSFLQTGLASHPNPLLAVEAARALRALTSTAGPDGALNNSPG